MSEWMTPAAAAPVAPPVPAQLPAEPPEPPEAAQLPAEPPEEACAAPEEPKRRRRGPISLEEKLHGLVERQQGQLARLKAREAALAEELEKIGKLRVCAEADLQRLLAVQDNGSD